MPIVFSAIVPHPPLLIPTIGKDNIKNLKATDEAYAELSEELYVSQAETIIVISPHGPLQENSFTMNLSPEFYGDFEKFGDLTTKFNLKGDVGLTHRIREALETAAPLQLISQAKLDHGTSIPLYLLTEHLPAIKVIPLYYCGLTLPAHFNFGQLIKNEILSSKNRIALIASGDLSHRLTKNAPGGYSPKGKKFDKRLMEYLLKKQTQEIIKFDHGFVADACECGLKSIAIMLGILEGMNYEPKLLSYEAPFGVGYMVMKYKMN
jgi:MEMO1 family protein